MNARSSAQWALTKITLLTVLAVTTMSSCERSSPPIEFDRHLSDPTPAVRRVDGGRIRSDMVVLAADDMQGREAGTEGHRSAAGYVASQLDEIGLLPLGDAGTYFQNIRFLESSIVAGSSLMELGRGDSAVEFVAGLDFIRSAGFGREDELITAPFVFVGFGVRAPEYNHDDFAGVSVRGKILVVLSGAPPRFSPNERAYYSSSSGKQALAVELGAVGIATIRTPEDSKRLPWERIVGTAGRPAMRWLDSNDEPHEGYPELAGTVSLSDSGATRLFELAGQDFNLLLERHVAGATGSFDLDLVGTLSRQSSHERISSPNVLGVLIGSDPELRDQYIVYTAHLDHLGTRQDAGAQLVFNGAYDNAAGVATILEIARRMSALPRAPRRSILFAAVTAEEKGLRGSSYLANNPPVAIENIVANINIDMPYLGTPVNDVVGFGVEHSSLHKSLIEAARKNGVAVSPDTRPELVRLIRSDQFSFVKQGIPGLNLKPGALSSSLTANGERNSIDTFLHDHYHTPSDDSALPFSEEGAAQFARVALTLGLEIANENEVPYWKAGDFFGKRFGKTFAPQAQRQDIELTIGVPIAVFAGLLSNIPRPLARAKAECRQTRSLSK